MSTSGHPAPDALEQLRLLGAAKRKSVMGVRHVEKQAEDAPEHLREMQALALETAWGIVWNRPGLDLKQRSTVTLAITTALARYNELSNHVGGALNNGLTETEIREIIMHASIYCGLPNGMDGIRIMESALVKWRAEEEWRKDPNWKGLLPETKEE